MISSKKGAEVNQKLIQWSNKCKAIQ